MKIQLCYALMLWAWLGGCTPEEPEEIEEPPCTPDAFEQNDDLRSVADLGEISDSTPRDPSDPPKSRRTALTAHAEADVDWFKIRVRDRGSDGDPTVYVGVSHGYEATVWTQCLGGTKKVLLCDLGTRVTDPAMSGEACLTRPSEGDIPPQTNLRTDCDNTSTDDTLLHIRVRRLVPTEACEKYTLGVSAD
jgi:hypothetical protein